MHDNKTTAPDPISDAFRAIVAVGVEQIRRARKAAAKRGGR